MILRNILTNASANYLSVIAQSLRFLSVIVLSCNVLSRIFSAPISEPSGLQQKLNIKYPNAFVNAYQKSFLLSGNCYNECLLYKVTLQSISTIRR